MLFNRLSPQTLHGIYCQTSLLIWYSGDESDSFQNLSLHLQHAVPVTWWLSREGENGLTGHSSAQLMPSLSTHCSDTTGKFTSNYWTLNFWTFHPRVCSTEALLQKHLEPASTVASWNLRIKTSPFTLVNDCCDDSCLFAFLDSFSGYYQLLLPTPILQLQVWLGTVQSIPLEIPQYCSHESDRIFPMKRTAPLLFFAIICDCSRGRTDAQTRTPIYWTQNKCLQNIYAGACRLV